MLSTEDVPSSHTAYISIFFGSAMRWIHIQLQMIANAPSRRHFPIHILNILSVKVFWMKMDNGLLIQYYVSSVRKHLKWDLSFLKSQNIANKYCHSAVELCRAVSNLKKHEMRLWSNSTLIINGLIKVCQPCQVGYFIH